MRGSSSQAGRHSEQGGALGGMGREQGEPDLDRTHPVAGLGLWTGGGLDRAGQCRGRGKFLVREKGSGWGGGRSTLILDWVAGPVLAGRDRKVLDMSGCAQTGCLRFWWGQRQNGSMFLGGWWLEPVS